MAGDYTDITAIEVPAEAASGDTVNVTVRAKNTYDYLFRIGITASVNGTDLYFGWGTSANPVAVDVGETQSYFDSFVMPDKAVTITVGTWYWDGDKWVKDDVEEKDISLPGDGGDGGAGFATATIRSVDAPSESRPGQTVTVTVRVKNTGEQGSISVTGVYGGTRMNDPASKILLAGEEYDFDLTFTMPEYGVPCTVLSWHDEDPVLGQYDWVNDETREFSVDLVVAEFEFVIGQPVVHTV